MAKRKFWDGFTAGAVTGIGATIGLLSAWRLLGHVSGQGRVLRLEKSLQIGRPVDEVFTSWADLSEFGRLIPMIERIEPRGGDISHWVVNLGGHVFDWDAEVTQLIPRQAIGWKSTTGPKHTGRVDFSPIGEDTLVHVVMNYAPPGQRTRLLAPLANPIEHYVEESLRAFKAALEGSLHAGGTERRPASSLRASHATEELRKTGTFGEADSGTQTERFAKLNSEDLRGH